MIAPRRVSPAAAREERHQLATDLPTEADLLGAASEVAADERGLRVKVGSCWYRLSDEEAGIRAYTTGGKVRRFWAGYYNLKAIDHYTGGVLAVHVESASTQEHAAYPGLYARLRGNLGEHSPRAIVADRGFSVSSVFEAHTRDGIASVIPWRKHYSEPTRKDHLPKYDRHGIPHCKHCGLEAIFHRFQHDSGPNKEPRLWFRCSKPGAPECERVQSILCKENWRLMIPLWRTSIAYQVLRARHDHYEYGHHRWRERYGVAGDSRADRPKRRGLGVQQLRASAALSIEWLTICYRQGWLGGKPLNPHPEVALTRDEAASYATRILAYRQAIGLSATDADGMKIHQEEVAVWQATNSEGSSKSHATVMAQAAVPDG